MELKLLDLGRCDYQRALELQYKLVEKRQKSEIPDILLLVEHPPVITLGNQAQESNVVVSEEYLKQQGVGLYQTNRGGDVTYHGYGQIVGYPIVDIKSNKLGIRAFVRKLEEVFIHLLNQELQIAAHRDPVHTGVWVGNEKIVAIGLAVKRGVTMHGFAFNVNTDLSHFNMIVPCGINDKGVTSIERIMGRAYDFDAMKQRVTHCFQEVYGYQFIAPIAIEEIS